MSTQPVQAKEPEIPKQIPELTDAYRKAHKNYVLVAGLLASWELIGIDPEKLGEKWGVVLKSPSGVPFILFTLLLYCGYKVMVEWAQCDPERRKITPVKVDYRIAHLIAFVAVAIGVVQYLARVRIADVISRHSSQEAKYLGVSLGILAYCLIMVRDLLKLGRSPSWWFFTVFFGAISLLMLGFGIWAGLHMGRDYVSWLIEGAMSFVVVVILVGFSRPVAFALLRRLDEQGRLSRG